MSGVSNVALLFWPQKMVVSCLVEVGHIELLTNIDGAEVQDARMMQKIKEILANRRIAAKRELTPV